MVSLEPSISSHLVGEGGMVFVSCFLVFAVDGLVSAAAVSPAVVLASVVHRCGCSCSSSASGPRLGGLFGPMRHHNVHPFVESRESAGDGVLVRY